MRLPGFVVTSGPAPTGDYSAAIDVEVSTLITRERTMVEHAVLAISLQVRAHGAAEAKVWSDFERRQSASRFAPGGAQKSQEQRRDHAAFVGSWEAKGEAATLELLSTSPRAEPLTLRCHAGTTEARPALGCEVLAAPDWLFAPGRDEASGGLGWLLLGESPGLWVRAIRGFHQGELLVTVKNAEHAASEADLTGSWLYR